MKKRKICIVTGTRAEYGLLRWLMDGINKSTKLDLQIVVTGMHLSPEFGLTYQEIENDGFKIDKKIEMLLSADTPSSISKSTGLGLIGFADAFYELNPDIVNVNGGAIAMGHPLGCTGAKLSVQLFNEMRDRKSKYGMVTMCVGTGQGAAGIYEFLN